MYIYEQKNQLKTHLHVDSKLCRLATVYGCSKQLSMNVCNPLTLDLNVTPSERNVDIIDWEWSIWIRATQFLYTLELIGVAHIE